MEFDTQQKGLDAFLTAVCGSEVNLNALLLELGFQQRQVDQLRGTAQQALVAGLLDSVHRRLMSESGKDTYYQIICRHYGLDGEPGWSLEEIATERGWSREYLSQFFQEILSRCRTQTAQKDLRKDLRQLTIEQLTQAGQRPNREQVAEKLERLTNLRGAADIARLDYEAKRDEVLKKVQAELDALDLEYRPILDTAAENIQDLENEIKNDVLLHGESVSGGTFRAVYTRGRISWDNDGIEEYAEHHPEVLAFRKQSPPTVALRIIAEKD